MGEDQPQCHPAGEGASSLMLVLLTSRGTYTYDDRILAPAGAAPYLIWHGLKEDRGGRNLLLVRHESMGEVAPIGQVQPHDPAVGLHQGRVHRKVCR